jgi:hypothetical protein
LPNRFSARISCRFRSSKTVINLLVEDGCILRLRPGARKNFFQDEQYAWLRKRAIHRQRTFQSWQYKGAANGDLPPGPDKYEDAVAEGHSAAP